MTDGVTGGCLCGALRFSFREKPVAMRACWCRACQYHATGNASLSAFFRTATLEIRGESASYLRTADSGRTIRQRFCPTCATPLFADDPEQPGYMAVRVGSLDDREIGRAQSTIWTDEAPSWARIDADTPSCRAQPPG
jgi:hypothetical protein